MLKYDDINIYFLTASGRLTDTPEHLRKNGIPKLPKTVFPRHSPIQKFEMKR